MKKTLLLISGLALSAMAFAGGLVTNQNQSAQYTRMLSRQASTDADAVFYNPAGTAFFDKGLTISLNNQFVWQTRTITDDYSMLQPTPKEFEGNLFTPLFPGVYAAYKMNEKLAFSLGFNPTAGGGSVKFDNGIPMTEIPVSVLPAAITAPVSMGGMGMSTTKYSVESMLDGKSISYGVQAGAAYKITEMLSGFAGVRMLIASNSYEGYLKNIQVNPTAPFNPTSAMIPAQQFFATAAQYAQMAGQPQAVVDALNAKAASVSDKELSATQSGIGYTPILGVDFKLNKLNVGVKYEFNTNMTVTNDTEKDDFGLFPNDQELRSDVPALLTVGASYGILDNLKISGGFLYYFDKNATMETWNPATRTIINKADFIDNNTSEYTLGIEWGITKKLTLSTGYQYSSIGVNEKYQSDIAHSLTNQCIGLGAKYAFTDKLSVNVGGLMTFYTPETYTVSTPTAIGTVQSNRTYDRDSKSIGIGIDYKF